MEENQCEIVELCKNECLVLLADEVPIVSFLIRTFVVFSSLAIANMTFTVSRLSLIGLPRKHLHGSEEI